MDVTVQTVQGMVAKLSAEDLYTASKFIQFLLEKRAVTEQRTPLDFSKYETESHIWNEDAQEFVNRMRQDDRF